ncbi:hypothetical protein [Neobacillus cucumis]|nr:hypothetical protein [Neobacillus cucumis]
MENNHFWLKGGHSSQELFHAIGTPVLYETGTCYLHKATKPTIFII